MTGSKNNIKVEFETSEGHSEYSIEESKTIANITGTPFIHLVHSSLLYLFCSEFVYLCLTEQISDASTHENCKHHKFFNNEKRVSICRVFLQSTHHGRLKKGTTVMVTSLYSVSTRVVLGNK